MGLEDLNDRFLVDRCNAGDVQAFEALYEAHRQWVYSIAVRFTGNREDALDVLQESFAYLFRQFPGFHLTSTIRAFFYPVVKHRSISIVRKRRNVIDLDTVREKGMEANIGLVWEPEMPGDFERLIKSLSLAQQEVVRLRFVLDMRLHEIADALHIPLGTVKSRLHTALKMLRGNNSQTE